jgi:hypothetical protein
METWYLTKVCHLSQDEKGMQKKITEHYLVDSESFTESESRTVKEVGECSVTTIRKTNIKEVFEGTGDYYKVRVDFLTLDENTAGSSARVTPCWCKPHRCARHWIV